MGDWLSKTGLTHLKQILANKFATKVNIHTNEEPGKYLQTDSNGNAVWGDAASPSAVATAVQSWLESNVSMSDTYMVDNSLLISGAAADAKVTGDIRSYINALVPNLVVDAEVVEDALYLLNSDGEAIAGPFTGFGGGGGGGGGGSTSSISFSFASYSGDYVFSYRNDATVVIDLTWSSVETVDEESIPTGNGTLKLTMDGVVKFSKGVSQGVLHEDVTKYLSNGTNTLTFQMIDSYGNKRSRTFTVNMFNLKLTSTFDDSVEQTGQISFSYIATGEVSKLVTFIIDKDTEDEEVITQTVTTSGRQATQKFDALSHGAHTLDVQFSAEINNETVYSNALHYEFICVEEGEDDVIIATSYNDFTVSQYTLVNIPYKVYTPGSQTSNVIILVNGETAQTLTGIGRDRQNFATRLDTSETNTITITSGNMIKILSITVTPVQIDAEATTEDLTLYLSSYGRSNSEANPAQWSSNQNGNAVSATFSNFNWVSDGWQTDSNGSSVMRVTGNARITIPYKPFQTDKRNSGFTIEIDFSTSGVRNYESPILSCMDGTRGIQLTSQRCTLTSEGSTINMQFKENEHVRVSFVIQKKSEMRLIYCYINGIMSGVTQYPENDNFAQITPQNISIGSNDATIDIYTIRVYDNDLTTRQIEDNWIIDTPDGAELIARYSRNNIRNADDEITISKLPADLPYMIITASELPQYKGDKKICTGSYTDPVNSDKSFTFENCEINVQGTSSQYYYRKNYDMKFNGGFTDSNNNTSSKYKLRDSSIAEKRFVMKADVASSEGANNVELVRLYNDVCPYKTPAQIENPKVRQGIDGFPIVIFWNNPDTNKTTFLGKYNFNNAKGNTSTFGFVEGDESWEMRNSGSGRVRYKDDSFSNIKDDTDEFGNPVASWQKDFECRYPSDEYDDYTQLKEFISWVKSTDPTQATGDALESTADFGETSTTEVNGELVTTPITYDHDTAAYRKAKFRAQLANYAEIDSLIFYYLFTEIFLMMDSRAKNSFPSFIGTPIGGATQSNE